jgi:hypothetical protein
MSFSEKHGEVTISGDFSRLEKLVSELGGKHYVDIGILGENNETVEGGITLAGIGAVHEFGTDRAGRGNKVKIPERSWLRMPLETGQEEIEKQVEKNYKKNLENGDIKAIFQDIGIAGESRIQNAFESGGFGEWAQNAESTVNRKGSDAPLIDDGSLRRAITSKVGP